MGGLRQGRTWIGIADVPSPARQLGGLWLGHGAKPSGGMGFTLTRLFYVPVAGANLDAIEAGEHVKLRDRKRVERLQTRRISQCDQIERAGRCVVTRGGLKLAALSA